MEDIKKAIEVLKYHQEWRKGAEIPQTDVKELTNALDTAIEILSKWQESERWRSLEDEPLIKGQLILTRLKNPYMELRYGVFKPLTDDAISIIKLNWQEWKPIH